jgi:threonyl-tRNA synthetase
VKSINVSPWSYKDLPKRYAEFGTVYRYEQSGELHGLTVYEDLPRMMHIFLPRTIDQDSKK